MQHLQLIWGSTNCMPASAPEGTLMAESGTLISEDAGAAAGACKPRLDMCNEKASMNAFTYCVWNAPFSGSACRGGCCFSSGKCASSSCAISGMGRDVANMICYGANNGVGFGGNSNCAGLACKLATPGCTTDAFGGNCVGTVAPFGPKDAISAESLKYIGAPCLDATPSDTTLDAAGAQASGEEGIYMGKLWTICDCTEGGTGLPEPAARLLNLTTTRISNFTKNEVLAAFSTLLPQKNVTDEAALEGKSKVVTLLPSFADMFKLPALSSISLPNLIGSLSGPKGAAKNASLPLPKLPDLPGLLTQIKPPQAADEQSAATQPVLNFESGSLPNGTEAASDMVETPGFAPEKPVRTLGSLFSRFTKPKEESNSDGSSTFTPGSTEADQAASTKVRPMTLGALLGGLRRAGPDNSTTAPAPAAAHAGNSTKKLDLSPIGALITKFINGPPPPAQPAAATSTAAPAVSANTAAASPAANGSVPAAAQALPAPSQSAPSAASPVSSQPANTPASTGQASAGSKGPAALDAVPKGKIVITPTAAPPAASEPVTPAASPEPGAAVADPNYIAGDPKNRPLTLAERLRAKKLADKAAKAAGNSGDTSSSTAPPAAEAPAPVRPVRKSGFSANIDLPHLPRAWEEPVTFGGIELGALMNTIGYLTQLLSDRGAGANPDDIAQVTALLTQLQQLPGGLASLPPDVSQALMVLAAEMGRVTAEQSAAQTPAEAPSTANAPAAAPSTAESEKQPAQPTEPSAQPVTAAVASQPATAEPAAVAAAAQPEPAAAVTSAAVPAAATTASKPPGAASAANSPAPPAATVTTAAVPAAVATAAKPTAAADTTVAKPAAAATVTTAAQPAATVATAAKPTAVTAAAKPAAAATVATAAQSAAAVAAAAKPKAPEATAAKPAATAAATVATAAQPAVAVAAAAKPTAAEATAEKLAAAATVATAAQPAAAATAAAKPEAAEATAAKPAAAVPAVKTAANPVPAAVTTLAQPAAAVATAGKPTTAAVATAAHPAASTAAKPTAADAAQPSVTKPTGAPQPATAAPAATAPAVLDRGVQDHRHVEPSAVPSSSGSSRVPSSSQH